MCYMEKCYRTKNIIINITIFIIITTSIMKMIIIIIIIIIVVQRLNAFTFGFICLSRNIFHPSKGQTTFY